MRFSTDIRMLKINAYPKLSISNPSISQSVIMTMIVFMTITNRPNVNNMKGKVKNAIMGLINVFSNASTMATHIAVPKLFTFTPRSKAPNTKTPAAFTNNFIRICKVID